MACYTINLKQLRNCGLSLNDKMCFKEELRCVMGGPFDIVRVFKSQNGISMWDMLDSICYNYSTENARDRMTYLSGGRIFEDIKTALFKEIEPKIVELQNKERMDEEE